MRKVFGRVDGVIHGGADNRDEDCNAYPDQDMEHFAMVVGFQFLLNGLGGRVEDVAPHECHEKGKRGGHESGRREPNVANVFVKGWHRYFFCCWH